MTAPWRRRPGGPLPHVHHPTDHAGIPLKAALALVAALHAGFAAIEILTFLEPQATTLGMLRTAALLTVFFALHCFHCGPYFVTARRRLGPITLPAQAVVVLALLPAGSLWGVLNGFLAGAVLVTLANRRLAWALYGGCGGATLALALGQNLSPARTALLLLFTLGTGLLVLGLHQLTTLVVAQHRARDRVARATVTRERLRFARDLHDLLGYSLTAITLKNELTYRLIGTNDDRARTELAETVQAGRQALAEVRAVVHGYSALSLTHELASVRGVLAAAMIEVTIEDSAGEPEPCASTVLATVLREAVTNVLRHSDARRCRIRLVRYDDRIQLSVANDGLRSPNGADSATGQGGGHGLDSLAARVAALGGSLDVCRHGGWFRLVAECTGGTRAGVPAWQPRPATAGEVSEPGRYGLPRAEPLPVPGRTDVH
ncbi:sensor histidine kinase [Streptomyces xiamenensis]|uniref:sensor histidine kinase n=1 Tax=Streptomyces xiamenensis TaxID=408015 RepID=UPI0036E6AD2D